MIFYMLHVMAAPELPEPIEGANDISNVWAHPAEPHNLSIYHALKATWAILSLSLGDYLDWILPPKLLLLVGIWIGIGIGSLMICRL